MNVPLADGNGVEQERGGMLTYHPYEVDKGGKFTSKVILAGETSRVTIYQ